MDKDKLLVLLKALIESLETPHYEYHGELWSDCYDTVFTMFANEMECEKCPLYEHCQNNHEKSCETHIVEYLQEGKYKYEQI